MYLRYRKQIQNFNIDETLEKKIQDYLLHLISDNEIELKRTWLNIFINISYPKIKSYKEIHLTSILDNLNLFPVDLHTAPIQILAKVPGFNLLSARKLFLLRKKRMIDFDDVNRCGGKLYIAKYFICLNQKLPKISTLKQKENSNQFELF